MRTLDAEVVRTLQNICKALLVLMYRFADKASVITVSEPSESVTGSRVREEVVQKAHKL